MRLNTFIVISLEKKETILKISFLNNKRIKINSMKKKMILSIVLPLKALHVT